MRVLISAYACEPGAGSEPGAGWAWTRAAAVAGHVVHLVTRENNEPAIAAALAAEPDLSITPVYFDLPARLRQWKRGQQGVRLYYLLWQRAVRKQLVELHARERFDVSHHLTFAIDWMPAAAVGIAGLPSIWGPVGGAGSIPPKLYRWIGLRGVAQELIREVPVRALRRHFGDRSARAAALVVAQNDDVADRFASAARRVVVEPNVALEGAPIMSTSGAAAGKRRHALFVGRLIPWKGLKLAISALDRLPRDWVLEVLGEGPEQDRCQRYAAKLGVDGQLWFSGRVSRRDVLAKLAQADVLLLPSMHDSAGWVVGEAASVGTPVVCLNLGGPATMVARGGGGAAIDVNGDVAGALARATQHTASSRVNTAAWDASRLPGLLDAWYSYAITRCNDGREAN